jgi:hypothetical protein
MGDSVRYFLSDGSMVLSDIHVRASRAADTAGTAWKVCWRTLGGLAVFFVEC